MTIHYFAGNQNLVFVPALLVLLVATVLICLPIMFAPTLRRSKRRRPLTALAAVLAVAALVGTAVLAGSGFRTLGDQRQQVRAELQTRYGVTVTDAQTAELLNGGKPLLPLPEQARAAKLKDPDKLKTLRLKATSPGADTYALLIGGQPWPS